MAAQIAAAVCGTSVSGGYSEATQATIATGDSGSVAGQYVILVGLIL